MDKLTLHSKDILSANIDKIGEIFPGVITEAKDENGETKKAIDFDLLRQHLSDTLVEGDRERFRLDWPGKRASILKANTPTTKTLRPMRADSEEFDATQNIFIEGDNFEVLKVLQESYLGKVKMIYIDPPYNTKQDFIYRDDFALNRGEYEEELGVRDEDSGGKLVKNTDSNGHFHSDWLSMMQERLTVARDLLSDDGIIFISIDYNENYNLRELCNEIFDENQFVGEIYWESKTKSQNTETSFNKLQPKVEIILAYTRQTKRRFNLVVKGEKEYPLENSQGKYREYPLEVMNASGIRGRESMIYEVMGITPPAGKQWQLGRDQVATYQSTGNLFIRDGKIIIKMRPDSERSVTTEPFWGFFDKNMGTAESAKKELTSLLGKHGFETVKPVEVIKRLIYHTTDKNDLVLDFFSGSGTTAHAVMQLNAEDGGNRKHIQVQLPEEAPEDSETFKAGYKTIPEMSRARIRKAAEVIRKDYTEQIAKRDTPLDTGFRAYKLASSNFTDTRLHPSETSQTALLDIADTIKPDRTSEDILTEVILDLGLTLDLPIEQKQVTGHTVYFVGGNSLVACFDDTVSLDIVDDIAAEKPLLVVFKNSSFASDEVRINIDIRLKQLSPDTKMKVI